VSTIASESVLAAVQKCLDSAKLISAIRPLVHECVSDYEACVDTSLSEQLELVSGLLDEYTLAREAYEPEYIDPGEEPLSHADAVRLLDQFIDAARNEVGNALNSKTVLFTACMIGVRAMTFSCVLRHG